MNILNTLGPFVRQAHNPDGIRRFVVVRYFQVEGGFIVQALSNNGEWVERPEGFEYDDEVLLRG